MVNKEIKIGESVRQNDFTWETVRKASQGESKLLRRSGGNRPPKSCVPSRAKMNINRNRMDKSETIDRTALNKLRTRLPSERQYLCAEGSIMQTTFQFLCFFYRHYRDLTIIKRRNTKRAKEIHCFLFILNWGWIKEKKMATMRAPCRNEWDNNWLTLWLWRLAEDGRNARQKRRVEAWRPF